MVNISSRYDRVAVLESAMQDEKRQLSPEEQQRRDELLKLIKSDRPEDWKKIDALLDADIKAMTPEERAELDASVDRLQWRIGKMLEEAGRKVFH